MIEFGQATKKDIAELIRMRIAYMVDDFGSVSEYEKECMEKQLPDYFERKLGTELIAFIAKDGEHIVSVAYLLIIEMPANSILLNGIYGEVLVDYGREKGLGRIDLSATKDGYPIYKKIGFQDKEQRYTEMRYKF